ncbi:MAG: MerR family DNA-binding transcriptional regulator [Propionibacteriaceae bacterium]|nr:MerR family DNA-binding transcriptional regulator [Propionibacteriaceae bacterium]
MELTIKQAADLVGLTRRTLRYYEQIGVLPEALRTHGGYRGPRRSRGKTQVRRRSS